MRTDLAFGAGVRFRLGPEQTTELEIFPAAGVVRLTDHDFQLALSGQEQPPTITTSGLIFARDEPTHRSLAISPQGTMTLVCTLFTDPTESPTTPSADPAPSPRPNGPLAVADASPGHPAPAPDPSPRPAPESQRSGQPRVTFAGRLGTNPRCRTTPREVRVCSFPIAEKRDAAETPHWLTVVTFKALAAKVEATLKKGMFVEGVGYAHERVRQARDGATRTETELYAVVITPR